MKTRIFLLLVLSTVLLSVHAGALPLGSPSVLPAAAPSCPAESASPALPEWAEDGTVQAAIVLPRCGACSQTNCRGAKLHAQCGIGPGGSIAWCQDLGTTCSQDGLPNCACSSKPLG